MPGQPDNLSEKLVKICNGIQKYQVTRLNSGTKIEFILFSMTKPCK